MSFLSGLFGDSLGDNHKDPGAGLTSKLGNYLDPLYWIMGKNSSYANLKNKVYDQTARIPNELNRIGSQVVTPIDNAVAPYTDPLYQTGIGRGLHQMVNNKPVSALAAALTGAGFAGAAGGAGAAGSSGLGAGGTFSGALGADAAIPSFAGAIPSIGGTGTSTIGGYLGAGEAAIPSIGGTGAASFGASSPASGFDFQKFGQNFLQKQGQQKSSQGTPQRYRSDLLDNYQYYPQQPADFNPMGNKGLDQDSLKMLIAALRSNNGG